MLYQSYTLTAVVLASFSQAVPVQLPATQSTQLDIQYLQQTIVNLANDIVQTNPSAAQGEYNTAEDQFTSIGDQVLTPTNYACPVGGGMGRPDTAESALSFLNATQNDLSDLSLHLQDTASSTELINNNYCNAKSALELIEYYVFNVLGQPEESNAKLSPTLEETYVVTLIALEALKGALNLTPEGQAATSEDKTSYTNAQAAIKAFGDAAEPGKGSCPALALEAKDRDDAIKYTLSLEKEVEAAYADTKSGNGTAHGDFCYISIYLAGVGSYVEKA